MTFSLKKNRRNTRSYSGSSTPAPSRGTASRPNTRNRAKPAREKRQFSLWSKLQGGRVQRFFCVLFLLAGLVAAVACVIVCLDAVTVGQHVLHDHRLLCLS